MPHGKICYLEIPAKTGEASAKFYSSIFGWKVRTRGDGALAFDDPAGMSGTWVKEGDRTPDERTRTYIMVDAIVETSKQIESAGGRLLMPRKEIGPGMGAFAIFVDPVGNEFGLYEEPHHRVAKPAGLDTILKRFEQPDEVREFEKGRLEIVTIAGQTLGRATYQSGWKWSVHVGPLTAKTRCEVEHLGIVLSGHATAAFDDGRVFDLTKGTVFYIPSEPHDSWVVGDEPYVSLHLLGADSYAK
jgi:uncharacterized protein